MVTDEDFENLRKAVDYSLCLMKFTAQAQGIAMGYLVATPRHLWLTLANLPDCKHAPLIDGPLTPSWFFGSAVHGGSDISPLGAGNPHPDFQTYTTGISWGQTPTDPVRHHVSLVLTHLSSLSLKVNRAKSALTPRRHTDFLGISLDTVANLIRFSDRRLMTIHTCLTHFHLGARVSIY